LAKASWLIGLAQFALKTLMYMLVRERLLPSSDKDYGSHVTNATSPLTPETDLPPVDPPTAGFIVQLFVIPAVVVCVVIAVWLLFGKMAGGERGVNEYVAIIRSENANRRFRAAYELASLITNEKSLAVDPKLLGDLTELLNSELNQTTGDNSEAKQYLALTLGVFQISEGTSTSGKAEEALPALARALESNQPIAVRIAAAESLARQAARQDGKITAENVVGPLAKASESEEADVRLRTVYALGFCGGEASSEALRKRLGDTNKDVAYNAGFSLIRRDDPKAIDILKELLTQSTLEQTINLENSDEKLNRIEAFQTQALRSLSTVLKKGHSVLGAMVKPEVETLTKSKFAGVSVEAKSVIDSLSKKSKN
jgi:hypothetical protein